MVSPGPGPRDARVAFPAAQTVRVVARMVGPIGGTIGELPAARPRAGAFGRVALIGDAGSAAPPFTGSGVFKAMNAVELADALAGSTEATAALEGWSRTQAERGMRLAALGRQMESAFVWDAPDFSTLSDGEARAWWTSAITFPEEFSYLHREPNGGRPEHEDESGGKA